LGPFGALRLLSTMRIVCAPANEDVNKRIHSSKKLKAVFMDV